MAVRVPTSVQGVLRFLDDWMSAVLVVLSCTPSRAAGTASCLFSKSPISCEEEGPAISEERERKGGKFNIL